MDQRTKLFLTFLLGAALLHAGALRGGFVWDDHAMIEQNPSLADIGNVPSFFKTNYFGERANVELYRPLVNVTLALDHAIWGKSPFGNHLTNLLLHLLAGLLLYALLRRVTDRPALPEGAALLFLLHPASAEPVAWIVGRADLLALVLTLATAHLHLAGRRRPWLHALALLTYLAALFGKLAAGPAPLLVMLLELRRGDVGRRGLLAPQNVWRYGAYVLPIVVYCLVREPAMGSLLPQTDVGVTWKGAEELAMPFVAAAILFRYVVVFLVPTGLCADYSADPVFRKAALIELARSPAVIAMAAGLVGLAFLAVLLRRRSPWLAFGVLWFLAALLPVSQIVRIGAVMADRYLYLPAAGGCVAVAAGVLALPRWRVPVAAVLLACFALLTASREAVWRSDLTMREDVLASYPDDADSWNWIGLHWDAQGDAEKEEAAYRRGLELAPGNRFLRKNLGYLLYERGDLLA
ncbi:MAG: tetratricopeptide repeat protein, partial [Planctomycetota bacterium]